MPDHVWEAAFVAKVGVITDITPNFRDVYAEHKARTLRDALQARGHEDEQQLWWRALMFDKLVCHTGCGREQGLNETIRQRLRWVDQGDWMSLATDVIDAENTTKINKGNKTTDGDTIKRLTALAEQGARRRVIAAMRASRKPLTSQDGWKQLQK